VVGARVFFKAAGAPGAIGTTDQQGHYRLTFVGRYPGAVLGENTISIYVEPPPGDPAAGSEAMVLLHQETRAVDAETREVDFSLPLAGSGG